MYINRECIGNIHGIYGGIWVREEDVGLNGVDDGDVVREHGHGILGLAGAGARELPRNPQSQESGPLSAC